MTILDSPLVSETLGAVVTMVFGVFTFLVRSYFKNIHKDLRILHNDMIKQDAKFDILAKEVRSNSKEVYGLAKELRAVWRFIENANQRATDEGGNNGRDSY